MEEGLRRAAQSGNIDALYALIQENADIFRHIDQKEFVDTPLHIAAAAGHIEFAMEMMNLKPSFARRMNQEGLSPIHLALQKNKTDMVVDLVLVDKDLVRVKGRDGSTPLHYVAKEGNLQLLSLFLDHCPYSIVDLTIRKESALHIAAQNNSLEALQTIVQMIKKIPEDEKFQRRRILNLQDINGDTVLHIAASNNQPQIIRFITKYKEVDKNKVNKRGCTALEILRRQTSVDTRESVNALLSSPSSKLTGLSFEDYAKKMKTETINALSVVLALVLTMTYQAVLSPPGGFSEGDASNPGNDNRGKSVLSPVSFCLFYIPNFAAFQLACGMTYTLLEVVAKSFRYFLIPIGLGMCFCYGVAVSSLTPSYIASIVVVGGSVITLCAIYFLGIIKV